MQPIDGDLGEPDALDYEADEEPDPAFSAARDLARVLTSGGFSHAIQGSYAALLHGAYLTEPPGDIDVLVSDMRASQRLVDSGRFRRTHGTMAVHKLVHVDTGIPIDIVFGEEFGIPLQKTGTVTDLHGVRVLSLTEVLVSLLLRPERRPKEISAFASLVLKRGEEADKNRVATIARLSWSAILDNARKAAKVFKIPDV